jgi:hypothetical protein
VANKFRAIAFNVMNAASVVYHPKIRTVKAEADKDVLELKQQHPDLKSTAVIQPGDPLWKDD